MISYWEMDKVIKEGEEWELTNIDFGSTFLGIRVAKKDLKNGHLLVYTYVPDTVEDPEVKVGECVRIYETTRILSGKWKKIKSVDPIGDYDQKLLAEVVANKERYRVVVNNDDVWVEDKTLHHEDEHFTRSFNSYGEELILRIFEFWGVEASRV